MVTTLNLWWINWVYEWYHCCTNRVTTSCFNFQSKNALPSKKCSKRSINDIVYKHLREGLRLLFRSRRTFATQKVFWQKSFRCAGLFHYENIWNPHLAQNVVLQIVFNVCETRISRKTNSYMNQHFLYTSAFLVESWLFSQKS